MNLTRQFEKLEKARQNLVKAETLRDAAEAKLDVLVKETAGMCRPSIVAAIDDYNATKPGDRISTDRHELKIAFRTTEKAFCLSVILRSQDGSQPDEEFYKDEVEKIVDKLRPFIEKRLRDDGIGLGFTGILVPSSYYMK